MMHRYLFALAWLCSLPAFSADPPPPPAEKPESWIGVTPTPYGPMLIQQDLPPPYRDYQMNRILTPEERKRWWETTNPAMGSVMQMDAREAMNHFAVKYKVKPGISFDHVVESMMLRGSQAGVRRGGRASGSYQEGPGKSGSYGMWNHPRAHVWNVFVRPASS